jgi:Domain of unknown function (DUF4180)
MNIAIHSINDTKIAEITSDVVFLKTADDVMEMIGNLYFHDVDKILVHQNNITPDFFDLKTGIAGEILQKFSNYRIRLAIVGDFAAYSSKSLKDFIFESNKNGLINFVDSINDALEVLSKK